MSHAHSLGASIPRTVTIGGMSRTELRVLLRQQGVQLNDAAEALFEDLRFTTGAARRDVEIAALSIAELGFAGGATYGQLVAAARTSGLGECPLELGPPLRTQFVTQPGGADAGPSTRGRAPRGSITVASPWLDDTDGTPKGFYLRTVDEVSWLRGYWSWPGHVWSAEDVLVFAQCTTT